jgi:hypothetical protein
VPEIRNNLNDTKFGVSVKNGGTKNDNTIWCHFDNFFEIEQPPFTSVILVPETKNYQNDTKFWCRKNARE